MNIQDSSRLRFRIMTEEDADLLFELDQDPEVMRYLTGGKVTTIDQIHERYIPRMQRYSNPEKGWGLWSAAVKTSGEFIGWILIRPMNYFSEDPDEPVEFENLEIGWRFKRSSWGNGYATEAAMAIINHLAAENVCKNFSAVALEENIASINIMKKIGMTYVKTYTHKDPLGNMECVYYTRPHVLDQ